MSEFMKLLPEQSLVRVVLNGGHQELDDATIPFTVGFEKSIAQKEPTHLLVIDFPVSSGILEDPYKLAYVGERSIYELDKINYIQFHRPGQHHLVFILFSNLSWEQKIHILQKAFLRGNYEHGIGLSGLALERTENAVGFCEEVVEIPNEFFAMAPSAGIKKYWHSWVNRWFLTKPVDECEFRKRAILALTIQPILWMIGFIFRLAFSALLLIAIPCTLIFLLLCGAQAKLEVWKRVILIGWDFLFLYPKKGWKQFNLDDYLSADLYLSAKCYQVGKFQFKVPISLGGLVVQITAWAYFIICLMSYFLDWHNQIGTSVVGLLFLSLMAVLVGGWHLVFVIGTMPYENVKKWFEEKTTDSRLHLTRVFVLLGKIYSLSVLSAIITQINWFSVTTTTTKAVASESSTVVPVLAGVLLLIFRKRIFGLTKKQWNNFATSLKETDFWKRCKLYWNELFKPTVKAKSKTTQPIIKKTSYAGWLEENMNLEQLPQKVSMVKIVAPTKTKTAFLRFKVSFWRAKAKVCRPYVSN